MRKTVLLLILLSVNLFVFKSNAQGDNEKLLVNETFQSWDAISSSTTETQVNKTTDFSNELLVYKLSEIQVAHSGEDRSKFNYDLVSESFLMAAKSATPYIELSPLASITKVEFIHAATGGSRGYQLWKKSATDADWVSVSNAYANPAQGSLVTVNINEENVALKFTNLTNNQNAYLFDLRIYGNYVSTAPQANLTTSVNIEGAGTINRSKNSDTYDVGTELTLTATANFGYRFVKWTDGEGGTLATNAEYTVILDADKTIIAVFEQLTTYSLQLTIAGSQWGEVQLSPEPVGGKYPAGTIVTATVIPNAVTSFSFWETGGSELSRQVQVNEDTELTATFDELSFIVGWNFKVQEPRGNRSADFFAKTDNKGIMNQLKPDGSPVNWLANTGSFSPSYPCIRKWTAEADFLTEQRYYQASFSTTGYTNIEVKSLVGGNYQVYTKQMMQYSLDGNEFKNLITVDIADAHNATWVDCNATLPTEAEGLEKVYIRWIADTASPIKGTGNDGTALTNIFVFADKVIVNDTDAPVFISSNPAEGSSTASANGSIVLTFNEKVQAVAGKNITLNGEELTGVYGSKTATFKYTKLAYNTEYTFIVPEGALTDLSGNPFAGITIKFRTMNRPAPIAKVFDAIVASDGTGDYTGVQAAIDAAPTNASSPYLIYIKDGNYTGHVEIPANKPFIHLTGQSKDGVIIADNRLSGDAGDGTPVYHVSLGATVVVNATDVYFENITFENTWGYEKQAGPQALAINTNNDRIIFKNCAMRSYQDTWITSTRGVNDRHYLQNCRIEGAVDYIYGGGNVFLDACTLYNTRLSGGYIVAPSHQTGTDWGYVFSNCTLDGPSGVITYLGRPWKNAPKAIFLNAVCKVDVYASGWYYKMGAIPAIFADYGTMDKNGNPLDLSQRIEDYEYDDNGTTIRGKAKKSLTDEEASQYTLQNVMRGTDDWDPLATTEATETPIVAIDQTILSWASVDYAICYVVLQNGKAVGFTTENQYTITDNSALYAVQAVAASGALSERSNNVSGTTAIKTTAAPNVTYYSRDGRVYINHLPNDALIEVFNFLGQKITQVRPEASTYSLELNGTSIVRVVSKQGITTFKVIK
ncbi:MAG: Ig-like domain-containing protein [Candidatus Symbiothrix sp.]|nr:Ig-like domain-containing protein [Candidatus Symbiothrix sp.]